MFNFKTILLNKMKKNTPIITNLKSFTLIATFFSLWLSVYFENRIEDYFAYILILSLGIFHGANDLKIVEKNNQLIGKHKHFSFLLSYLSIILLTALAFYIFPSFVLAIFILCSAYHFGEQHWNHKMIKPNKTIQFFLLLYGLIILFILFYANSVEVSTIIKTITSITIHEHTFEILLITVSPIFLMLAAKLFYNKELNANFIEELFYLLVFFIVFSTASLLWGFAIYFILWHSIPSLVDQVYFLYGDHKKEDFYKYAKSSFLYWLVSIIGLLIVYWIFHDQEKTFLAIFFSSIAAITFPHVWVMSKLKR